MNVLNSAIQGFDKANWAIDEVNGGYYASVPSKETSSITTKLIGTGHKVGVVRGAFEVYNGDTGELVQIKDLITVSTKD